MKSVKAIKKHTAIPGTPMTEEEFKEFIKAGEKGSFMPSAEFKRKFELWKKGLEK